MKTICIVACHSNSELKKKAIIENHIFLMEITDDILYINSEECKEDIGLPMIYIKNDEGLCYSKYLHALSTIDLSQYDNFILTNDSIFITRSIYDFKNLFLPQIEMSGMIESNQIQLHYPDFLRRYNKEGIKKVIEFLKQKLIRKYTYDEIITEIEIEYHKLHNTLNVLYPAIPNYYGNIHFDDDKIKEYKKMNYPIVKIRKMEQVKIYMAYLQQINKKSDKKMEKNSKIKMTLNKRLK
jgi:hypothetical protein